MRNVSFLPEPQSFLLWVLATWLLLSTFTAPTLIQTINFCLEYSGVFTSLSAPILTRSAINIRFFCLSAQKFWEIQQRGPVPQHSPILGRS